MKLQVISLLFVATASLGNELESERSPAWLEAILPFDNPTSSSSAGGASQCVTGHVHLHTNATNYNILTPIPPNNAALTEYFVEQNQAGPTKSLSGAPPGTPVMINGTFAVFVQLCVPSDTLRPTDISTVQVLTHGGLLDYTYWDLAPGYSYVDASTKAGYATISYDRLGTGLSDHPDPAQIVQLPIQAELLHRITRLAAASFSESHNSSSTTSTSVKVVGVGHSEGSAVVLAQLLAYPQDLDAVILSGISTNFNYSLSGVISTNQVNANTVRDARFQRLPNGYFTPPAESTLRFAFFRYPNYDESSK